MPRQKTVTTVETIPPEEIAAENIPADSKPQFEEDENSIPAFLKRIGNDAIIKIFRKEFTGKIVFCGEVSPEYFSEAYIQKYHGAGDYSIKAMLGGRYVIGGSRQISIAPAINQEVNDPDPLPTVMPPVFNSPSVDPSTLQMEMIREEMRMQRDLMMKIIEKSSSAPAIDLPNIIASLANVARMFTPPAITPVNPLANVESVMNLISKGIEIGQTGSVEPKKEGVMGYIKDLAPVIGEVIGNLLPARANGGGGSATVQSVPSRQVSEAPEIAQSRAMLAAGIAYLKRKALSGADVGLYIDFIGDNMSDPQWTPLVQMIHKPYDEVAGALDPELSQMPYRPWFESLFNGVRELIKPSGAEADEPANQSSAGTTGNDIDA